MSRYRQQQFDKAATTYQGHSSVHQHMAAQLLSKCLSFVNNPELAIGLELGCGTGNLSVLLHSQWPKVAWIHSDFSILMLRECKNKLLGNFPAQKKVLMQCDAEARYLCFKQISTVFSNAVVQWFVDLKKHFTAVYALLESEGTYVLSGFEDSNFPELQSLLPSRTYPKVGHSLTEALDCAKQSHFEVLHSSSESWIENFSTSLKFLRSIKNLGASLGNSELIGQRRLLANLCKEYDSRYANSDGIYATWKPWYLILKK